MASEPHTIVLCILRDRPLTSWCGRGIGPQEVFFNTEVALRTLSKRHAPITSVCSLCCDEMEKLLIKTREARGPGVAGRGDHG